MARALGEPAFAVNGQNAAPERDRPRIALVLDDLPFTGESIEYQGRRVAAYTHATVRLTHEEF